MAIDDVIIYAVMTKKSILFKSSKKNYLETVYLGSIGYQNV